MTKELLGILITAILVENFVLAKFLGICPFLGVSKKMNSSIGMSLAVIFVMVLATAATWPIQVYILNKYNIAYLQTIVFILVIAALVQLVEMILKKYVPSLHKSLGIYLPLITTNCAVLGVTVLNFTKEYNFVKSLVNAFGAGVGFLLAMVLFSGVRARIEDSDVPESFKGLPITLIAASITALSFMGFAGIVEGLGLIA